MLAATRLKFSGAYVNERSGSRYNYKYNNSRRALRKTRSAVVSMCFLFSTRCTMPPISTFVLVMLFFEYAVAYSKTFKIVHHYNINYCIICFSQNENPVLVFVSHDSCRIFFSWWWLFRRRNEYLGKCRREGKNGWELQNCGRN